MQFNFLIIFVVIIYIRELFPSPIKKESEYNSHDFNL